MKAKVASLSSLKEVFALILPVARFEHAAPYAAPAHVAGARTLNVSIQAAHANANTSVTLVKRFIGSQMGQMFVRVLAS